MGYRAIQDTVPYSETLAAVSHFAERLYWRMLSQSDSWGRLPGSTAKLRARCVPLINVSDEEIEAAFAELERIGRVVRYGANGSLVCQLLEFDDNQPPEFVKKRGQSKFPEYSRELQSSPERSRLEVEVNKEGDKEHLPASHEPSSTSTPSKDDVRTVYDHWRSVRDKSDPRYERISDERRKKVQARLREFSVNELCRALDAVAHDDWPERARHDDLTVLFKNRESVDRWLELADKPELGKGKGLSARDILNQAVNR